MVQSINKHCGGSFRKQLSEVMDVFWKSPLQKTRQGTLNRLKEREIVLFRLVFLLLLGSSGVALFFSG